LPVEGHALFADGKLAHVRAHRFVEFVPAHAEIARRIAEPDKPRLNAGRLCCCGIRHGVSAPPAAAGWWISNGFAGNLSSFKMQGFL